MQIDHGWQQWIQFPTLASIVDLLSAEEPPQGSQTLDPDDAVSSDIFIRDYDATNKHYPDVLADLLNYCGFVMRFSTTTQSDGTPHTSLVFSRRDGLAKITPKALYHAADGATSLDPSANNIPRYNFAHDLNSIANQVVVETDQKQIEATFYLAPLFQPNSSDTTSGNLPNFSLSNLTNATSTQRRMYRWYGVDECGDGYWNAVTMMWETGDGCDLSMIMPDDKNGNQTYVKRYRPGSRTLISKDKSGKPLKAVLEIRLQSPSDAPQVGSAASTGGWYPITHGWQLLDDRLGIEITINDPNEWHTGCKIGATPSPAKINGIEWAQSGNADNFELRLTTVIDTDQRIDVTAKVRTASPTQFARNGRSTRTNTFNTARLLRIPCTTPRTAATARRITSCATTRSRRRLTRNRSGRRTNSLR